MRVDLSEFLIWILAGIIGWLIREWKSIRAWARIRRAARAELAAPDGTNDPEIALAEAVVRQQATRIKRESISIVKVKHENDDVT